MRLHDVSDGIIHEAASSYQIDAPVSDAILMQHDAPMGIVDVIADGIAVEACLDRTKWENIMPNR